MNPNILIGFGIGTIITSILKHSEFYFVVGMFSLVMGIASLKVMK